MRGFGFIEAFESHTPSGIVEAEDGIKLSIKDPNSRALIGRSDPRGDISYGIRHAPDANVKLYNASKNPDASLSMSFSSEKDPENYDDILKIVKSPNGGYELHLQKINALVLDGKRLEVASLTKYL
jgi:hypothetical protein